MKNKIAKPGFKFVLVFTLPSGSKFVAGDNDGFFALIPISDGIVRGAIAWDCTDDVVKWIEVFKKENGAEAWKKIMRELNPEIGQVKLAH